MITCDEFDELLLEADIAELRGDVPGPLASHLAACDRCRRRARIVVDEHERLERALGALERAPLGARRRFPARRAAALLLPAAAAAGALFVLRSPEAAAPIDAAELYAALHPPRPLIEPQAGVRAAVIGTDENVTLVLLYPGDIR